MRSVVAFWPIILAAGCADPGPLFDFPPSPGLTTGTVAVLPAFALQDAVPDGDHTSAVERTLSARGYRVLPASAVAQRLKAAGLWPAAEFHHAPMAAVRGSCTADAVVYVHVERTVIGGPSRDSDWTTRITVRDLRNGEIIWRCAADERRIESPLRLPERLVDAILGTAATTVFSIGAICGVGVTGVPNDR